MKAELIIYKIVSFLLLPVAVLFGINCLFGLLAAIGNPAALLVTFLLACLVIYIIVSFIFLTRGIDKNSRLKPSLRDWIRINGIITFLLCLFIATLLPSVKIDNAIAQEMLNQMEVQNHIQLGISLQQFQAIMNSFITFLMILSIVLIGHVLITFHFLRKYSYLFEPGINDSE